MYRLLIVTNRPEVRELFLSLGPQEMGDFKAPHFRTGKEDAIDCMKHHMIDAIAVDSAENHADFVDYLNRELPDLPLFALAGERQEQAGILRELEKMLLRLRADDTNSAYRPSARFAEQRRHWLKKVICGQVSSLKDLRRQANLYRYPFDLNEKCWLGRMSIPQDDSFLSDRWHYGSERLEVALKNFFGEEHDGMWLQVAVVSPEEVRVLVNPLNGALQPENTVRSYLEETAAQITNYLGLMLCPEELVLLDGLTSLAEKES